MKENDNNEKDEFDIRKKITERELVSFNNKIEHIYKTISLLKPKINSMVENIKKKDYELQYGLSFFESKQDMLLIYLSNILFYCLSKICGSKSIEDLHYIKDNIKLSSIIERIKIIETKLQYQIKKITNIDTSKNINERNLSNEMDLKPKILTLGNNERKKTVKNKNKINESKEKDVEEKEEEEIIEENENSNKEKEIKSFKNQKNIIKKLDGTKDNYYKVKCDEIDFYENKEEKMKRKRQLERDREKIRNSEIIKDLRNEISEKPVNYDDNDTYLNRYIKEKEKYENEHFVNLQIPKRVIKHLKKKDRKVDDLSRLDTTLKLLHNTINEEFTQEKSKIKKTQKDNPFGKGKFINKKRKK